MEEYERIKINEINKFIDSVPYISNLQKDFYKTYILARYEKILMPTYKPITEKLDI